MYYKVESVVCDYGVYEYKENGDKELCLICNVRSNALLIASIMNTDLNNKTFSNTEVKHGMV